MKTKQLPGRAASRGMYVTHFLVACIAFAIGLVMIRNPETGTQDVMIAWGMMIGSLAMIMKETALRRAWKRQQKA
jgi:hypothetical protein